MRILHVEQGSDEWRQARAGLPTASRFDKLVTPKTLKPSAQADALLYDLVAEWLLGRPLDDTGRSAFMERGTNLEDEARAWYAWERDCDPVQVGLCLLDDGTAGCSPDALVGEDGGLEIKVPSAGVHVHYLDDPDALVAEYRLQVQGSLWVTGRKWWDLLSWSPAFPSVLVRVEPDEKVQEALGTALRLFQAQLEAAKARFLERGIEPRPPVLRLPVQPPAPLGEGEAAGESIDLRGTNWA